MAIIVLIVVIIVIAIVIKKKDNKKDIVQDDTIDKYRTILDYNKAEKLIPKVTEESHNFLDEISFNIKESLSICNNIFLVK